LIQHLSEELNDIRVESSGYCYTGDMVQELLVWAFVVFRTRIEDYCDFNLKDDSGYDHLTAISVCWELLERILNTVKSDMPSICEPVLKAPLTEITAMRD